MRLILSLIALTALGAVLGQAAIAADDAAPAETPAEAEPAKPVAKAGKIVVEKWRFGYTMTATGGGFKNIQLTKTVPIDWPDQRVKEVAKDVSPGVTVRYRNYEDSVKQTVARQMCVFIPSVSPGRTMRAVITYEIKRLLPDAPADTAALAIPPDAKSDRDLRDFLRPSPMIESDRIEIRTAAEKAIGSETNDWRKVEHIYDWVRKTIRYKFSAEVKGAFAGMVEGEGDCDEMTCLFVAACRSQGVPARTVQVPKHCYPEFYMVDASGRGRWYPCQAAGTRAFGSMFDSRPILQKGDNVTADDVNTKRKTRFRFLPENVSMTPAGNQEGEPELKRIEEKVKDEQ